MKNFFMSLLMAVLCCFLPINAAGEENKDLRMTMERLVRSWDALGSFSADVAGEVRMMICSFFTIHESIVSKKPLRMKSEVSFPAWTGRRM